MEYILGMLVTGTTIGVIETVKNVSKRAIRK